MGEGRGTGFQTQLGWPDALVVVLYFAFVLGIGLYVSSDQNNPSFFIGLS